MDLKERFWQAVVIDIIIQADNAESFGTNLDYVNGANLMSVYKSQTWHRQQLRELESDSIQYAPFTEEDQREFERQEEWLDNVEYQREDAAKSCELLQIPWRGEDTVYRMPGIPISAQLRFWQPVAIKAMIGFQADRRIRACVLGGIMGLGKTWRVD